jgi:hypothetical protein
VLSVSDGELRRLEVLRDVNRGGLPVSAAHAHRCFGKDPSGALEAANIEFIQRSNGGVGVRLRR